MSRLRLRPKNVCCYVCSADRRSSMKSKITFSEGFSKLQRLFTHCETVLYGFSLPAMRDLALLLSIRFSFAFA